MPHHAKAAAHTALVAATALSTVFISGAPAAGEPGSSQAATRLRELSRQAEVLTEDFKKAQDDHAAKRAELDGFNAAADQADRVVDRARGQEERFRAQVDELTRASYQGARLNALSAMLVSESPEAFLDRASALELLARHNDDAVRALASATERAESARRQAQRARVGAARAEADAARLEQDIGTRKAAMDSRIAQVEQQYDQLSAAEKGLLSGRGSDVGPIAGAGAAVTAVNAALRKQGSPYVWGAKGPNQFDCSGLVQWSYEQAGVSLPASTRSQVSAGRKVSESDLQPGDVIFYYGSASHDAIYIGGGKVVHAPTEGQDVKVENYEVIGDIHSVRRIVG